MNSWLEHVARYRKTHPNLSYKECLQKAKASYKKGGSLFGDFKKKQLMMAKRATGGTLSGGKAKPKPKRKRGRPKKMKGGNIFDDIAKVAGSVAPFVPLLL